ncbi:hypothetical protein ACS0TY_013655 [Phlomoides rotata]
MDSDDDYQSFSPPKEQSPPLHLRRLKRLKKTSSKTSEDKFSESIDPLFFQVDFAKLEALENDSEGQYFNESNSPEEINLSQESMSQGIENVVENDDKMDLGSAVEVSKAKRVLEFDAEVVGGVSESGKAIGEDSASFDLEKSENEQNGVGGLFEEKVGKEKKQKKKSDRGDELKTNKRREEKERKTYLKELHAESQRLLRETRDASFRPIPLVQKPISSVLEKIRKRKLEITKKSTLVKDIMPKEGLMDLYVSDEEIGVMIVEKDTIANSVDRPSSLDASSTDTVETKQTINESDQIQVLANEEPTPAFRAPVDDTQDLFDDSEPNGATAVQNDEQLSSPLKEDYAPSLLAMNLKFDSAPLDDSSSEEEDNDKENVVPHPCEQQQRGGSSSPKGDPVKDFIDEEAEEEDDSDNDLNRFQENEAVDDIDDLEELNDMIAAEYEERPTDKERRNELHQKWLEQQDAAGTDHLMQRLKCGSELRDAFGSDSEPETDEDVEEFDQEAGEDSLLQKPRGNIKKAKQIILESFLEKEDTYLSDDDDGTLRRHAQCLIRKEGQVTVLSPDDDANSSEVFGLIKKLNIVSENKKKPKSLSIFDSVLQGENRNHSSKSSFLGRVSKNPLPSSHKQGSTTVRAFIFGRDDSNSRSSISMSEDSSSDTVNRESGSIRNITAKYCNSRSKVNRDAAAETKSKTSLLEILKRPSQQSQVRSSNQNTAVDLTKTIFSFRSSKKAGKD